jgi:hypothetical protein
MLAKTIHYTVNNIITSLIFLSVRKREAMISSQTMKERRKLPQLTPGRQRPLVRQEERRKKQSL